MAARQQRLVLTTMIVLTVVLASAAVMRPVPVASVRMGDGFWAQRQEINRKASIPSLLKELEEHGIVDNFRRISGRKNVPRRGPRYTDSDLYKWMEAAAYVPEMRADLDRMIDEVAAAQKQDGYLNTYYADGERHTDMRHGHELYCGGHLIQAGIAH